MSNNKDNKVLDVYLSNHYIGRLTNSNYGLSFTYDPMYLKSKDAVKLSRSLPLQEDSFGCNVTESFFSGLLPDGRVRYRLARYIKTVQENTFRLLKEVGGDCAGAVSVYPAGVNPGLYYAQTHYILNESDSDEVLSSLDQRAPFLYGEIDVRMVCAGAQEKLTISLPHNKVAIPTKNTPSTHIIKPAMSDLKDSVQNEFFCMMLAKKVGLNVPRVEILWIKEKAYYVIERYDREVINGATVKKLHQEDFCQALSIMPEVKYEDEGGPSIEQCF